MMITAATTETVSQRCTCPICHERFDAPGTKEAHLAPTTDHCGIRCMTPAEMALAGLAQNAFGRWHRQERTEARRRAP